MAGTGSGPGRTGWSDPRRRGGGRCARPRRGGERNRALNGPRRGDGSFRVRSRVADWGGSRNIDAAGHGAAARSTTAGRSDGRWADDGTVAPAGGAPGRGRGRRPGPVRRLATFQPLANRDRSVTSRAGCRDRADEGRRRHRCRDMGSGGDGSSGRSGARGQGTALHCRFAEKRGGGGVDRSTSAVPRSLEPDRAQESGSVQDRPPAAIRLDARGARCRAHGQRRCRDIETRQLAQVPHETSHDGFALA